MTARLRKLVQSNEAAVSAILILLVVITSIVNPRFMKIDNILDIFRVVSYNLLIAAPLTCLLICGEMDLSFGAVVSLGGIACGWAIHAGLHPLLATLFALIIGLAIGAIKAALLCVGHLPGFITTLGLQYAINGLILVMTSGTPVYGFSEGFDALGQSGPLPKVYWSIIIALAVAAVFGFILRKTRLGRSFYAVGGNRETARLAGIDIVKASAIAHLLVSILAAFVGVVKAARFNSAQIAAGTGTELLIISAVVIGGAGMNGGKGTIIGSLLGCMLMAVIDNALILMRISSYYTNLIFGTILILALAFDVYRQKQAAHMKA